MRILVERYKAKILVRRDTEYTRWQRFLMLIGVYLPIKVENWISSFLPDSTYEVEVLVSGDVTPIRKGQFYGPPELCFPDEGGEVDIIDCWVNGNLFELLDNEYELAIEALWEAANDDWAAAEEEAAVLKCEARYG